MIKLKANNTVRIIYMAQIILLITAISCASRVGSNYLYRIDPTYEDVAITVVNNHILHYILETNNKNLRLFLPGSLRPQGISLFDALKKDPTIKLNSQIIERRDFPKLKNLVVLTIRSNYWDIGDIRYLSSNPADYWIGIIENGIYYKLKGFGDSNDTIEYRQMIKDIGAEYNEPQKVIDLAKLYYTITSPEQEYEIVESYADIRAYYKKIYQRAKIETEKEIPIWDALPQTIVDGFTSTSATYKRDDIYQVRLTIATAVYGMRIYCVTISVRSDGYCSTDHIETLWSQ